MSVPEIGVVLFEAELDSHMIVLVQSQTESVTLEGISIAHSSVAEVDLRALREGVRARRNYEVVIIGHIFEALVINLKHLIFFELVFGKLGQLFVIVTCVFVEVFVFLGRLVASLTFLLPAFLFFSSFLLDLLSPQSLFVLLPQLNRPHDLLLHEKIKVIVTLEAAAQVIFRILDSFEALSSFG